MNKYRSEVIKLYKTLLYMGREYPLGYPYFREKCHRAFTKNKAEHDPEKVKKLIGHGEYVVKELTALYYLKKYRTMKNRYYAEDKEELDRRFKKLEGFPNEFTDKNKS